MQHESFDGSSAAIGLFALLAFAISDDGRTRNLGYLVAVAVAALGVLISGLVITLGSLPPVDIGSYVPIGATVLTGVIALWLRRRIGQASADETAPGTEQEGTPDQR